MTSDSDGSFTGAASPRDLQSPVFHDKVEVSEGITSHSFFVYGSFSVKFIFQHYSTALIVCTDISAVCVVSHLIALNLYPFLYNITFL